MYEEPDQPAESAADSEQLLCCPEPLPPPVQEPDEDAWFSELAEPEMPAAWAAEEIAAKEGAQQQAAGKSRSGAR